MKRLLAMLCFFLVVHMHDVHGGVRPNSLFTDHMVLQQGVAVPVWGRAGDGERVTVTFAGQTVSAVATNGKWMARLEPLPYISTPASMTVAGSDTVVIRDILVGEVWLCSGQSNMDRQLGPRPPQQPITDWEKERDAAEYPLVRQYHVPSKYSPTAMEDGRGAWSVCSPGTVSDFSAVGYFFAKHLHAARGVPVGIIVSAFGGTPAEDWTSRACRSCWSLCGTTTRSSPATGIPARSRAGSTTQ